MLTLLMLFLPMHPPIGWETSITKENNSRCRSTNQHFQILVNPRAVNVDIYSCEGANKKDCSRIIHKKQFNCTTPKNTYTQFCYSSLPSDSSAKLKPYKGMAYLSNDLLHFRGQQYIFSLKHAFDRNLEKNIYWNTCIDCMTCDNVEVFAKGKLRLLNVSLEKTEKYIKLQNFGFLKLSEDSEFICGLRVRKTDNELIRVFEGDTYNFYSKKKTKNFIQENLNVIIKHLKTYEEICNRKQEDLQNTPGYDVELKKDYTKKYLEDDSLKITDYVAEFSNDDDQSFTEDFLHVTTSNQKSVRIACEESEKKVEKLNGAVMMWFIICMVLILIIIIMVLLYCKDNINSKIIRKKKNRNLEESDKFIIHHRN